MFLGKGVGVPMIVQVSVMLVEMSMFPGNVRMGGGEFFTQPFGDAGEIQNAEENEHQPHGKFHGQADTRRDDDVEENDGGADKDDGDGVAESPKSADEGGFRKRAFAADDSGNGDDVIGIGGMAHAEEEADGENGESADH